MAKRNRPILYEVFGSQTRAKGEGSGSLGKGAKKPARRRGATRLVGKELRVSYELAAVFGLLTVVLGGTLYYFGWVRGNDPGSEASLASRAPSERTASPVADSAPLTGPEDAQRVPRKETCYAVRVFTASYASDASKDQVREQTRRAIAVQDFLISKGYADARATRHARSREVRVYVGRADTASALDSTTRQIRRVTLDGKRQFKTAYPTRITVGK